MSDSRPVRRLIDEAMIALPEMRGEEPDELNTSIAEALAGREFEELYAVHLAETEAVIRGARYVQGRIKILLGTDLGIDTSTRLGDQVIRHQENVEKSIVSQDSLWTYIGKEALAAVTAQMRHVVEQVLIDARAIMPAAKDAYRVSGLEAVAKRRGDDARLIVGTLIDVVEKDPGITVLPISKAPKFLQKLEHGERIYKPKRGRKPAAD